MAIDQATEPRVIHVTKNLLVKNAEAARQNREAFRQLGVCAVNVLSSPGAGKTALLQATWRSRRAVAPVGTLGGQQLYQGPPLAWHSATLRPASS